MASYYENRGLLHLRLLRFRGYAGCVITIVQWSPTRLLKEKIPE